MMESMVSEILTKLCKTHTSLADHDISFLTNVALELKKIALERNVDVFIDCLCKNQSEAIVVAEARRENSLYAFSTIGYTIREDDEPAVFRSLRFGGETEEVKALTHAITSKNLVLQDVKPIKNKGKTIGVLIYEKELSKENKKTISATFPHFSLEEKYHYLTNIHWVGECINDALIILNERKIVCYRNNIALKVYEDYGYINDILNAEYTKISLHGTLNVSPELGQAYDEQEFYIRGKFYICKQYRIIQDKFFYVIILHDITQDKRCDNILQQKKASIREAHHRIKNSLHMIYSLLDIQARRNASKEASNILKDTMSRILSIAASYEVLQETDLYMINLYEVMKNVARNFKNLTEGTSKKVQIIINPTDITIETEIAASVALIINELLQNSYKHAFIDREYGQIIISAKKGAIYSSITVHDDGVGFSVIDFKNEEKFNSLGLQLIQSIVEDKLKGRFIIESDSKGTNISFEFKTCELSSD